MGLFFVAMFALGLGYLLGSARAVRHSWVPVAATALILGVAAYELIQHHSDWPWSGTILAGGVVIGCVLTEALALRDHPGLVGAGFLQRVRVVLGKRRWLREPAGARCCPHGTDKAS